MEITVNVSDVDLATVIGENSGQWDDEREDYHATPRTIADVVAAQFLAKALASQTGKDLWNGLTRRITDIRDEEIRAAVIPIIAEAITGPIHKTNSYGELLAGQSTTLRELIGEEAKTVLAGREDSRNYSNTVKSLRGIVRDEVTKAMAAELGAVLADEKAKVVAAVKDQAATIIAEAVKRGLSK